ncbi:MAG: trimeric autotransporter adhesin [Chthoniobacter sp.]|jgi:hypothetical protein|nr:trimeric autotransporter adhesin [Chthoniobacter sp.]
MKNPLVFGAMTVITATAAQAATLLAWEVNNVTESAATLTAGTIAAGISGTASSGVLSRGAGAAPPGNAASNSYGASGFDATSLANALTAHDYFTFSIAPTSGNQMTLTNIAYNLLATTNGATGGALFSSIGGFATTALAISTFSISGGNTNDNSIPLGALFQNVSAPVEFRVYFFGGQSSSIDKVRFRDLSGADLTITGIVAPEPSVLMSVVLGFGVLAGFRRRRCSST